MRTNLLALTIRGRPNRPRCFWPLDSLLKNEDLFQVIQMIESGVEETYPRKRQKLLVALIDMTRQRDIPICQTRITWVPDQFGAQVLEFARTLVYEKWGNP